MSTYLAMVILVAGAIVLAITYRIVKVLCQGGILRTSEQLSRPLQDLIERGRGDGYVILRLEGSNRFIQFNKYTNQGGDGIELSFPNADWSREYFGKLQSVCNAEGIPYRVSTGSDGMSFVDIDCGIDIDFALGLVNTINARVFCTPTSPRYVVSLRNAT